MSDDIHTPRSTGEIISDAVHALRRAFGVIFTIAVPFCAIDLFLREVGQSFFLRVTAAIGDPQHADLDALQASLPSFAAGFGFLLGSFFTQLLLSGAVIAVGDEMCHGRVPTVRGALARLGERGAAIIVTGTLFLVVVMIVTGVAVAVPMLASGVVAFSLELPVLIIGGAIVGLVLAFLLLIVLTLRWSLYSPAVVVEGKSMFKALARSSELTAGRGLPFLETPKFRLSVLFLVGMALSGVLQSLFIGPRLVMAVLTGWSFADGSFPGLAEMPIWFMLPFGLLEIVTNATVIPFTGLLLAFFAFDLRVRYEGVSE
ncbi:MAG: hypothetical protein Q8O67_09230 [Deltaproteobacteria bacterium]|nr:hypothetical protein [Deltaproteobacteria bacterium]